MSFRRQVMEIYFRFETQSKFTCAVEEQWKTELNNCLQMFYVSIRQKDGSRFKVSSLKASH